MKTEDKNTYEAEPKRHYKKRYLLRKLEEQEAEQEIVNFDKVKFNEDSETGSESPQLDGGRPNDC